MFLESSPFPHPDQNIEIHPELKPKMIIVLHGMMQGMTNKEIADKFGFSIPQVKRIISSGGSNTSLFEKLNVSSREMLVFKSLQLGLLPVENYINDQHRQGLVDLSPLQAERFLAVTDPKTLEFTLGEIADINCISQQSLKNDAYKIYNTIGVKSRAQAVVVRYGIVDPIIESLSAQEQEYGEGSI